MDKFSLTLLTTNETVVFNEYSKYKSNPHHIVIFPEDKINELKEKLYIAIGIPPYKQHLFVVTQDNFAVPLYYNIIANGLVNVDIRELHTTKGSEDIDYNLIADSILGNDTAPPENKTETEKPETPKKAPKVPKAEKRAVTSKFPKISGVPIDTRLYEEGDGIVVEGKDVFMTVGKVVDMFPNCKFMCANIDDYKCREDLLKQRIQQRMGDCSKALFATGSVSWKRSKGSVGLDVPTLLLNNPELLNEYPLTRSGSRRFLVNTTP